MDTDNPAKVAGPNLCNVVDSDPVGAQLREEEIAKQLILNYQAVFES